MKLSYWKEYDLVFKTFSAKKVYKKILVFAQFLGKPFKKKGKRGPKFKVSPEEYTAYIAFKMAKGDNYRDMELDTELFFEQHLDHSTFQKNFKKIPYTYLRKLLRYTGLILEQFLGRLNCHIVDSTKITEDRTMEIIFCGKRRKIKKTYKLHALIQRHPKKKMTVIKDGIATSNHVSDSGGAIQMLDVLQEDDELFGDRGFDYEQLYKECAERKIKTTIKPQDRSPGKHSVYRKKVISFFNARRYKRRRGIVETVFSEYENQGLTFTHLRDDDLKLKYGLILQIRHNIKNILRVIVGRSVIIVNYSTNSVVWSLSIN